MVAHLNSAAVLLIAGLFAVAAVAKLRSPSEFRAEFADYDLAPRSAAMFAPLVPIAEVASAGLAVIPGTRTVGAACLLILLLVFSAAVVVNLLRGNRDVACACFGSSSRRLGWAIPLRNLAMGAALASGVVLGFASQPALGATIAVLIAAVLVWALVTATDMLEGARALAARIHEVGQP